MERQHLENLYYSHDVESKAEYDHHARVEKPQARIYQHWLINLGALLIVWGSRLQQRYETLVTANEAGPISESKVNPC